MRLSFSNDTTRLVAPFAVWMVLMMVLPPTPLMYAVRTLATLVVLFAAFGLPKFRGLHLADFFLGVAVGIAVCVVWVAPDYWEFYRRHCVFGEVAVKGVAESGILLLAMKLFGSAFVVPVAEELFFRKWLIGFAGFWWMVALFALEHNRPVVGALAGITYGVLYLRRGLFAAIVAHMATNLLLGVYVIVFDQWRFW